MNFIFSLKKKYKKRIFKAFNMIFKNKTLLIEISVIAVFLIIKPLSTVLMNSVRI